jgi:hypothetical protein
VKSLAIGRAVLGLAWLALAAAGCATTHQWIYDKPGMTPESLDRDRAVCRAESPARGVTKVLSMDDVDRDAFTACMQRRGYTARREIL